MVLMLIWTKKFIGDERGDTLVEVTIALGIMATVLVTSVGIAIKALNLGVEARARVELINAAQGQVELLRSFRDNSSWPAYLNGTVGPFSPGIINAATTSCQLPSLAGYKCFYMGTNSLIVRPISGSYTSSTLPYGALVEIPAAKLVAPTACDSNLEVHYGLPGNGSSPWIEGEISVKLVNLTYTGKYGLCT
jgi:Flp pilus assembly pilin Flp